MSTTYINKPFVFTLCVLIITTIHSKAQEDIYSSDIESNNNIENLQKKKLSPLETILNNQKIGLVLSGGGAKGAAHIGVIKALEENNIPIDFITGTSMGAIIGGMYAIGMTPDQIQTYANSSEFNEIATGVINDQYKYYFKKETPNASWISLKVAKDTVWETSLPTNLINPVGLDFMMMENSATASAAANYNFDSLFIPFRCVAADIESKKEVVFKNGNLNEAIRTSATFPFYLKPIRVNGKLLFDGGLYNNFPADVMFNDFFPDLIIGSNVSGNVAPPTEDNVLSHIKNMLVSKSNFSVICENGILIEPEHEGGTFSFNKIKSIIDSGYAATIRKMPEIKASIHRRVSSNEIQTKREIFKSKKPKLIFDEVIVEGLNKSQSVYVKKVFSKNEKKDQRLSIDELKPIYYRLFQDNKIGTIFPKSKFNPKTGFFDLHLQIKKAKDISLDIGGNLSNRPISGAFLGLQYNYLGPISISTSANTYIGKLYKSGQIKTRVDFPIKLPFYVEPHITYNQWDYFKSSTDFFDNETPSYLLQKENYIGTEIAAPLNNQGKISIGIDYMQQRDEYYQISNFTKLDTTDRTNFNGLSSHLCFEKNTLNKKQYANKGHYFALTANYIIGEEQDIPGSTSINKTPSNFSHSWIQLKLISDTYYNNKGPVRLGFYFEAVYSNQPLFNNYTSSILKSPAFQPTTENKTMFFESLRAFKYAAIGQKILVKIQKNVDIRLEGYMFQPYRSLVNNNESGELAVEFSKLYTFGSGSLIYHSPIGPLCLNVNYYHNLPEITESSQIPITFLFHFGYTIFNRKAIK